MKRILVLQMCRLGDILQTVPMLRGLRRVHPDAEVTLVLHDLFAKVPVPRALYDRLALFPYTRVAGTLSTRKSAISIPRATSSQVTGVDTGARGLGRTE